MADIIMPTIVELANKWHISGDVLMDNANVVLAESKAFLMGKDVEIDFAGVTDVDTAALSLIMEWQRRATASNCKVTFSNLPANLTSLAALYGVTEFIPLSVK